MDHHNSSCSAHHHPPTTDKVRLLVITLILVSSFAVMELGVGFFSHSLALLADSGHMISDCLAIVLALFATWMARKSKVENHPIEVIAALINGIVLVLVALWIGWEAVERLQSAAVEILSLPMLITACVGFGVNSINIAVLHQDSSHDLNLRGALLHVMADAVSSVGVILAAIAIWAFGWNWADGVVSLLVSGLIIISATPLIIESSQNLRVRKNYVDNSNTVL